MVLVSVPAPSMLPVAEAVAATRPLWLTVVAVEEVVGAREESEVDGDTGGFAVLLRAAASFEKWCSLFSGP